MINKTFFPGYYGVSQDTLLSSFAFSTDLVVDSEEYLRYDLNVVVASIGGFLGMFLGISLHGVCLLVLSRLIKLC